MRWAAPPSRCSTKGETFTTVELKINFLKPVWEGRLTAVGEVIKAGRTLTLCDCRVTDGRRLARGVRDIDVHDDLQQRVN